MQVGPGSFPSDRHAPGRSTHGPIQAQPKLPAPDPLHPLEPPRGEGGRLHPEIPTPPPHHPLGPPDEGGNPPPYAPQLPARDTHDPREHVPGYRPPPSPEPPTFPGGPERGSESADKSSCVRDTGVRQAGTSSIDDIPGKE